MPINYCLSVVSGSAGSSIRGARERLANSLQGLSQVLLCNFTEISSPVLNGLAENIGNATCHLAKLGSSAVNPFFTENNGNNEESDCMMSNRNAEAKAMKRKKISRPRPGPKSKTLDIVSKSANEPPSEPPRKPFKGLLNASPKAPLKVSIREPGKESLNGPLKRPFNKLRKGTLKGSKKISYTLNDFNLDVGLRNKIWLEPKIALFRCDKFLKVKQESIECT